MATRDLTYLIDFNVEGAEALSTATTNMEELATATNGLDEETHTVDIQLPETLSTDIDDVGTSLDDMGTKTDDATTKGGLLESAMGKVAVGALAVQAAIDIGSVFIEHATALWEAYRAKQELTEQVTRGVTEAILEQSGALDIAAGELEDVIANAETADQILTASIWEGIEATQGAEEIEKIRTALLDLGLGLDDLGSTIVSLEEGGGGALANIFGGATGVDAFNEAIESARNSLGQLPPALADISFEDFSAAVGTAVQQFDSAEGAIQSLTNQGFGPLAQAFEDEIVALEQLDDAQENVDYGTLIEQTLAAAESSETLRGVLDEVRTDLGPDASEFEVWQEYVSRLQEVQTAAEETDTAIDDAAAPRTGEFDSAELEDARTRAAELSGELDAAAEDRETTVTAEADVDDAEDDLDALPQSERVAVIDAEADTAAAATALLDEADKPRTAYIIADALVGIAQGELNDLVNADRTAVVDVVTGQVDVPTAGQIAARIGPVPVRLYGVWTTRTEGSRPR